MLFCQSVDSCTCIPPAAHSPELILQHFQIWFKSVKGHTIF